MAEHKHAEVLRAIADGRDVQFFHDGRWHTYNEIHHAAPQAYLGFDREWRVKPEHKPDYVEEGYVIVSGTPTCRKVNVTIDGETNEPKSVDLIK